MCGAARALGNGGEVRRAHIVQYKTRGLWALRWTEDGERKTKVIGTVRQWPTRRECEQANRHLLNMYNRPAKHVPTIAELIKEYRKTDMPERASTRRGYESYFENHLIPQWGSTPINELRPDPLEQWLRRLKLSTKTKRNIRGLLSVL